MNAAHADRFGRPGLLVCVWMLGCIVSSHSYAGDHAEFEGSWQLAAPTGTLTQADDKLPFSDDGRKMFDANKAAAAKGDFSFDTTTTTCSSPGVPRLQIAPMLIKLIVRPDLVTFLFEWNGLFRLVDMKDERREAPPIGQKKKLFANRGQQDLLFGTMTGKSYGHWVGNDLLIESEGFSDQKLLDNYLPNSEDLKVHERIRLVNRNKLEDQITVTDPQIFTAPWSTVVTYTRRPDRAFEEYVCLDRKRAGEQIWPR
jgi:hypothetical protein